nr:transposase zinc-binding domain-containing protein [Thiocystis violacea]
MAEPASLQAVIRSCLDGVAATQTLSPRQWQVCHHVLDCRTAALGGLALSCDQCEAAALCYHACRDRHCPCCQRRASLEWCASDNARPCCR